VQFDLYQDYWRDLRTTNSDDEVDSRGLVSDAPLSLTIAELHREIQSTVEQ
jgi:hypothetical protein